MRAFLAAPILLALLAGCVADEGDVPAPDPVADGRTLLTDLINQTLAAVNVPMTFEPYVVTAAVDVTGDLYEPTIEVSDSGAIFITGHTIAVDTTGAPVFSSYDDGVTWQQLPWFNAVTMPSPVQGATPPPSDEIFLAAGDDGWLYGVDITLATYPVNAWSHDGRIHTYHNPNAYDETKATPETETMCVPRPAKDRPWGAYENGTLLMVSNPAGDRAQVGVMSVPPRNNLAFGAPADDIQWNLCAGPGGSIPGVPDIRADGFFGVPQLTTKPLPDGTTQPILAIVIGNRENVMGTSIVEAFPVRSIGEITSFYGHVAFDTPGTMFVGITNNTWDEEVRNGTNLLGQPTTQVIRHQRDGQMLFAASTDDGNTFINATFTMPGKPLRHFYMDANEKGPGALVVWAIDGETRNANNATIAWDWYVGHLQLGANGAPEMVGVHLAINEGPRPSAHVTGAAVGPDGRAYLAMYTGGGGPNTPGLPPSVPPQLPSVSSALPLSVYVQRSGPGLPTWT
jgi:hypothetical protein